MVATLTWQVIAEEVPKIVKGSIRAVVSARLPGREVKQVPVPRIDRPRSMDGT